MSDQEILKQIQQWLNVEENWLPEMDLLGMIAELLHTNRYPLETMGE